MLSFGKLCEVTELGIIRFGDNCPESRHDEDLELRVPYLDPGCPTFLGVYPTHLWDIPPKRVDIQGPGRDQGPKSGDGIDSRASEVSASPKPGNP